MREADIRPAGAYEALLEGAGKAFESAALDTHQPPVWVNCPACASDHYVASFRKNNFLWNECQMCGTLFVSMRPSAETLADFYVRLSVFRDFYAASAEARREAILKPRAKMIEELSRTYGISGTYCDIGCGAGELLGLVGGRKIFGAHFGIEPSPELAREAQQGGVAIEAGMLEYAPGWLTAGLATAFEVVEHVFSPLDFLQAARRMLAPSGILVFTTLTCDGWDISELMDRHMAICPPLHLNIMSIKGLESLVERAGLDLMELTTPGRLDVDILRNAVLSDPSVPVSRFARRIAEAQDDTRDAFQAFLRQHRLSSHVQVLARRAKDG